MNSIKRPLVLLILLMTLGLGLQIWYWPQLPQQIAIHFDATGTPNNWMDKLPATLLSASLVTLLPIFFVSLGQLTRRLPSSMINIPHREYWLAIDRREETQSWMTSWLMWFSVAITAFVIVVNHLTFVANRDAQTLSTTWFWGALGLFLLVTFVLVFIMMLRFKKPSQA